VGGLLGAGLLLLAANHAIAAEPAALPDALKAALPNTWVNVLETKTGSRAQPIFVYASQADQFVLASGARSLGRHAQSDETDARRCGLHIYQGALPL